jgi:hypothetical protein
MSAGMVACRECGAQVPADKVEMTGHGWRCQACSLRHQIDIHQGADEGVGQLSLPEMQQRADKAFALAMWALAASIVVAILIPIGALPNRTAVKAFFVIPAGIAVAAYELVAWRRARRAVAVMLAREA